MRIPESLAEMVEDGIIEEVVRPLMSGKEAQVFLVVAAGKERVAKVYKNAQHRSFRHRAEYTEGRGTRNTRDRRAMDRRSKHRRARDEEAWHGAEVAMIRRLRAAGVRVPVPHRHGAGVLLMELIVDENGAPAPRLGDVALDLEAAQAIHARLVRDVVRMLCAGIVHGDLSEFNVLVGADGPVIIDFPQSVDASSNPNARKLLVRDVDNLHRFLCRFEPRTKRLPLAEEMWELYETNQLTPETELTGTFKVSTARPDTHGLLDHIDEAYREERRRREASGLSGEPPGRRSSRRARGPRAPMPATVGTREAEGASGRASAPPARPDSRSIQAPRGGSSSRPDSRAPAAPARQDARGIGPAASSPPEDAPPSSRRRRRRRRRSAPT